MKKKITAWDQLFNNPKFWLLVVLVFMLWLSSYWNF